MLDRAEAAAPSTAGVLASLGASALFGVIFVLPSRLVPLDPEQILGYRIVVTLAVLALLLLVSTVRNDVVAIAHRCRRDPRLVVVIVIDAALLGVQLWLFGWAPQTGHGLEVSLGYLILPLVMVLIGVVVYRERLSVLRGAAVAVAGVGVVCAVLFAGGLGWPTLVVVLGLPMYLVSRRAFGVDSTGAQLLEIASMLPFAAIVFAMRPSLDVVRQVPDLALTLLLLGIVSACAFTLYLTASRMLPFALFGVLSYVEPVLLVGVSVVVLGERWGAADVFTYLPICIGLSLLAVDALRSGRRQSGR